MRGFLSGGVGVESTVTALFSLNIEFTRPRWCGDIHFAITSRRRGPEHRRDTSHGLDGDGPVPSVGRVGESSTELSPARQPLGASKNQKKVPLRLTDPVRKLERCHSYRRPFHKKVSDTILTR